MYHNMGIIEPTHVKGVGVGWLLPLKEWWNESIPDVCPEHLVFIPFYSVSAGTNHQLELPVCDAQGIRLTFSKCERNKCGLPTASLHYTQAPFSSLLQHTLSSNLKGLSSEEALNVFMSRYVFSQ